MAEFAEVQKVGSLLSDLPCSWFVCGGWALDLFLGRVTRPHKDVDVAVARADQLVVRDYLLGRGWALERAEDGELIPWPDGERLELPSHAVWCRNSGRDPDFFEVLLNEIDGGGFRFRRDQSVTLARGRMSFRTPSGLPKNCTCRSWLTLSGPIAPFPRCPTYQRTVSVDPARNATPAPA